MSARPRETLVCTVTWQAKLQKVQRIICIPGNRDDGRDSYWYDTVRGERVPQPKHIALAVRRIADRKRRRRARGAP